MSFEAIEELLRTGTLDWTEAQPDLFVLEGFPTFERVATMDADMV